MAESNEKNLKRSHPDDFSSDEDLSKSESTESMKLEYDCAFSRSSSVETVIDTAPWEPPQGTSKYFDEIENRSSQKGCPQFDLENFKRLELNPKPTPSPEFNVLDYEEFQYLRKYYKSGCSEYKYEIPLLPLTDDERLVQVVPPVKLGERSPEVVLPVINDQQLAEVEPPVKHDEQFDEVVVPVTDDQQLAEVVLPMTDGQQLAEVVLPVINDQQLAEVEPPVKHDEQLAEVEPPVKHDEQFDEVVVPVTVDQQLAEVVLPVMEGQQLAEVLLPVTDDQQSAEVVLPVTDDPQLAEVVLPVTEGQQLAEVVLSVTDEQQLAEVVLPVTDGEESVEPVLPVEDHRQLAEIVLPKTPQMEPGSRELVIELARIEALGQDPQAGPPVEEFDDVGIVMKDETISLQEHYFLSNLDGGLTTAELFKLSHEMASVSYQIAHLLEKMLSSDKDFRFMATNDLMTELQKDSIKLDDDSERKVVRMLLKLLEDKNGEVQNLAVKCLGPLVNKVKEFQVETIVESLCTNMVSDKEQLRDISSIGLKIVIAELPQAPGGLSGNICKRITGRLTTAIERQEDVSVQLEALDIVTDLLYRFGGVLQSFHSSILNALLPQLCSHRQAVRKRTISACSNLVLSCNNALYGKLIEHLYNGVSSDAGNSEIRTYVQCIASVCRQSGHKFGEYIDKFVPLIHSWSTADDDELREYCLHAFESFVHRCPKEITPYINGITDLCLSYMTYDPNYNYDEDDANDKAMDGYEEVDDEEENDEYSDDDDMSWKVRRSAAKCLETIISTRHELLSDFYKVLSPALIARFKEREENVKSDIFRAYIALLKQTKATVNMNVNLDPNSMEQEEMPVHLLQQQVPFIIRGIQPQMREKSMKTRQDCFTLLKELCSVLPGALTNHIGDLMAGILFSMNEKNASSNMKIDALSFIYCLLTTHPPEVFHPHINTILPPVINAVGDTFYKITAEALNVLQELVKVIRPVNSDFDFTPFVSDIYMCTLVRLKTADIDQEVKEKAISTMGQVICSLGDHLQVELPVCLPLFLERLKNEITRLTTVKALTKISGSPLALELPILGEIVPVLGLFLRKNQRALKLSTLQLLDCLITNYNRYMYVDLLHHIIVEIPPLLDESDLHIAQWTLVILKSIAETHPRALQDIRSNILPQIMHLVKSPLLQGSALVSMLDFFKALVICNLPGLTYHDLLSLMVAPINLGSALGAGDMALHKQAYYSLAKCVAAITVTNQNTIAHIIPQFVTEVTNAAQDSQKIFALLVIGEIGREVDLTSFHNINEVILTAFVNISEEVKSAASYALGSICIGNLPQYLPFILQDSDGEPRRQYLLLHALKEVITCLSATPQGVDQLLPFIPAIWEQLFRHCESNEEGTRNVVAECLGKLTLIDPANLLPKLKESLDSDSVLMRTTVVTAVKFTISDQPASIDPLLRQCIGEFLNTLQDSDLNVRRVALVAFNSAAHNKPSLIRDLLETILPQLYSETNVKRELIREVEMGPFKHTVDDGLDIRKAAFECMYTLLDSCLDRIDIFEFINHVENGLKDHYDIKMLTYLMVARLSQICPGAVLQSMDRLVEPLKQTCTMKVKANSVKQEYEKQDELKRSALRAVVALLSIPDADKNQHLNEFISQIKGSPDLNPIFDSIQKDASGNHTDCVLMDQS